MREVVVVSAARIPFGKFGGYLKDYSAVDLGTRAVQAVMEKIHIAPETVEELIMGVAVLAGTAAVAARQILYLRFAGKCFFAHVGSCLLFFHDCNRTGLAGHCLWRV